MSTPEAHLFVETIRSMRQETARMHAENIDRFNRLEERLAVWQADHEKRLSSLERWRSILWGAWLATAVAWAVIKEWRPWTK